MTTEAERVVRRANEIVARAERGTRIGREVHADEVMDLIAAYVVMRGIVAGLVDEPGGASWKTEGGNHGETPPKQGISLV